MKKQDWISPAAAAGIAALDQGCKAAARKKLRPGQSRRTGRGAIRVTFRNSANSGAAMNLLDRYPEMVKNLSIGLTGTVAGASAAVFAGHVSLPAAGRTGFALLLGGALSNTLDRVTRGYVTDYISFDFGPEKFREIAFNLGDFAIAAGTVLLALTAARCPED